MSKICLTFFCLCDKIEKNEKWSEFYAKKENGIK